MYYNIKVSNNAIEQIKNILGFDPKQINLKTGIICVTEIEEIKRVAQKFEVENVNRRSYEEVVGEKLSAKAEDKPEKKESSADPKEIKKIVGNVLRIGAITRISTENGTQHVVITAERDDKYDAVSVMLRKPNKNEKDSIILRKGIDVVYRNPNYKEVVTIGDNIFCELERDNFMTNSGGLIIGRIVNEATLDKIVKDYQNSIVEEELGGSAEKKEETIILEDVIRATKSWEERLDRIHAGVDLRLLVSLSVEKNTRDLKRLIHMIQKMHYPKFTQPEIKKILESQLVNTGVGSADLEMNERTLPYFLKMITSE